MTTFRTLRNICSAFILFAAFSSQAHQGAEKKPSASYQKPGAPVRVLDPGPTSLANGETATIEFKVQSGVNGRAGLEIRAQEGLYLQHSNASTIDFNGDLVTLPVTVSADKDGRYYIYLSIDMYGMSRNVSYGIDVGDSKAIEASFKPSNPAVDGIKRQKAIETVYQK